ncbi:MAG: hypothetical protein UT58_C0017G0002 [Microgenomates group bacterium GW2011_GWC1_39_7b]|uniref:Uncharacterized protein n=3 Tax=Candidatus Woeseibacteriota TaxID=1752722 RepID=A0A0G0UUU3_9BACT|nr:MAG: hypothetical protein UT17_C0002G0115 [Candidatus Woesebacteria bacterium GW2011_GWB1_39_10]KKR26248.1 MAG: hypothetical protein UT58_C0017G0002 [Microgenomates group bacterium GW2011_GWC1_39_7b]KKR74048.1 MAG: hypothetical protein UU16_C0006G0002 [Candidatus Woesebacteria bacterium GW2011_GWA2_40_7]KKR92534.1 MAG: hypothetical protein UU42_C0001G0138 [Candidatus Woesebacteria bacterium GW2011_GWA1_41_13b]
MLETPHVAVGIAIATKFPNPWIAIPLAFASHFLLDKVPHWNPHLYTETQKNGRPSKNSTTIAIVDIATALAIGSIFAYKSLPDIQMAVLILACSLASVLSDVIKYPYYYFHLRQEWLVKWVNFERSIQVDTKSVFWGIVTQGLVIAASMWWIL